jgi:hypothetical protein
MKAGEGKAKQYIALVLGLIAVLMVVRAYLSTRGGENATAGATSAKKVGVMLASLDPRLHLNLLANAEDVKYTGQGKNIFRAAPEVVIPPVKVSPLLSKRAKPALPPPPPPPPPINLKFFGFSNSRGQKPKVFLTQGEEVWVAHEGDVVDRHYKIVRITPTAIEVEDLLNNNTQSIHLTQG